jgi:hypothetical protein
VERGVCRAFFGPPTKAQKRRKKEGGKGMEANASHTSAILNAKLLHVKGTRIEPLQLCTRQKSMEGKKVRKS